jgi:hypothetical protein
MRLRKRMLSRSEAKNKSFDDALAEQRGRGSSSAAFPIELRGCSLWRRSRLARGLTSGVYWE